MKEIYKLRIERNDLVESFKKSPSKEIHDEIQRISSEIESLIVRDSCIKARYLDKKKVFYTEEDYLRITGENPAEKYNFHNFGNERYRIERKEKDALIIPSENKRMNEFFKVAVSYCPNLSEFSLFYHVFHRPKRTLEKCLDITEGSFRNLFVEDFVYKTDEENFCVQFGDIGPRYHTDYNAVLSQPVWVFGQKDYIYSHGHDVFWADGYKIYGKKKIGEIL